MEGLNQVLFRIVEDEKNGRWRYVIQWYILCMSTTHIIHKVFNRHSRPPRRRADIHRVPHSLEPGPAGGHVSSLPEVHTWDTRRWRGSGPGAVWPLLVARVQWGVSPVSSAQAGVSIPRLLHSHVRQVRMEEISDQTHNAGDDSEDVSLPVRHILALRCLLLKVLAYLDIRNVFMI